MTLEEFKSCRALEGSRVRLSFSDGYEVIARLVSIAVDFDESRHVIYDQVESPSEAPARGLTLYEHGENLIHCVLAALNEEFT